MIAVGLGVIMILGALAPIFLIRGFDYWWDHSRRQRARVLFLLAAICWAGGIGMCFVLAQTGE